MRLIVLLLAMLPTAAGAREYLDAYLGNDVLDNCGRMEPSCVNYVLGVFDGMTAAGARMCAPNDAGLDQIKDVALQYIEQHAADRHLPAGALVARAFEEAWPCS